MSAWAKPHMHRRFPVLLAAGIIVMLSGLSLIALWLDTTSQPGGPGCPAQTHCQQSGWYSESTRNAEVEIAFPLLILGVVLLVIAAVRH